MSASRPDGRDWSTVLSEQGYTNWSYSGELRMMASPGFPTGILVDTWMREEPSKICILSPTAATCGIGLAHMGSTMYLVVIITG